MNEELTCFKAYDVRGELGPEFNNETCYRIARAFAQVIGKNKVVVGWDARETSPDLSKSVIQGLIDEGATGINIGLAGTEEMYWGTT